MVKLRLKRTGSKFNAKYQIVAANAQAPRDGRFIEKIGYYNPQTKELVINEELKNKFLKQGAQPTDTVKTLFKKYAIKTGGQDKTNSQVTTKKTKVVTNTTKISS